MMKIALCFSGQPRFLKEVYPYIQYNVCDGYDVDVVVAINSSNCSSIDEVAFRTVLSNTESLMNYKMQTCIQIHLMK